MIRQRVPVEIFAPEQSHCWADLCYDPDLPMAVTVVFVWGRLERPWQFARDLLDEALHGQPSGLGDVRLTRQGARLMVAISSHEGDALVAIDASSARRFLLDTYQLVPRGAERIDVDYVIAELFDGAE